MFIRFSRSVDRKESQNLDIRLFDTKPDLSRAAASQASEIIRDAIVERGQACITVATGASHLEFLEALTQEPDLDWSKVTCFHLDEYIGLPVSHPASFRKYLKERLVDQVHPYTFHFVDGEHPDPSAECRRLGQLISDCTIDVAFVGIGENGHLAFNDPPANFEAEDPFLVVQLDEACRRQQLKEGWFDSLEEVPCTAISMSIRQILRARKILCIVPDQRKAAAVRDCLELEISPWRPASSLRLHDDTIFFFDRDSASLLASAE